MDSMERFKLRLQLAANTKDVRMGQTKDFLVWRGEFRSPDDGEWYHGNKFVFWYPCTGAVREVFMSDTCGWSLEYDDIDHFLETAEVEHGDQN